MNQCHTRKAQTAGLQSESLQPFHILKVRPYRIHRLDVSGGGGRHQRRAAIEEVARFAQESFPAQQVRRLADGSVRAVLRTTGRAWLVSELLRWGATAVVESPPELKQALAERAAETLKLYER